MISFRSMTHPSRDEAHDATQEELLKKTNKPRFCYLGYAPPLCIGDQYDSVKSKLSGRAGFMSVPYPKKGRNPDSFFSTYVPLCVGDIFPGSLPARKNADATKIPFRPTGRAVDSLLGRFEYVGNPEPVLTKRQPGDQCASKPAFIPPSRCTGKLFHETFEYMPNHSSECHETNNAKHSMTGTRPPFRVPTRSTSLPGLALVHDDRTAGTPAPYESSGKRASVEMNKPPFRPGGSKCLQSRYPEYVSPQENEVVKERRNEKTQSPWKIGSPNLNTSPNPSIVFMNLLRG